MCTPPFIRIFPRAARMALTALAVLSPASIVAQSATPAFGAYGGLTMATFRGSDAVGPTYIAGFTAAVFARWRLDSHFALQPELAYVQKGSDEVDISDNGFPYTMHIRLHYIEVPVLLRAEAKPIAGFTPFAVVGPEVAFKAGCGIVVSGLGVGPYTCANLPAAESVDYGGVIGGGVSFDLARRRFDLSARYDAGFANAFSGNDAKNRTVSILLGTLLH
jgi:Outer membrane protein beta-barrel domain